MPMTREELIDELRSIRIARIDSLDLHRIIEKTINHLQSSHEELESLKRELSAVRSLALKNDARASDADQYEQWLLDIGKQIGCQHLDEQLPNCVIQTLQGDAESSHEAELRELVSEVAEMDCDNSLDCVAVNVECIHDRARALLNKIKGE